jgi:G3E family GTPase
MVTATAQQVGCHGSAPEFPNISKDFKEPAEWQLKQADIVTINKVDQCETKQLADLKQQLPGTLKKPNGHAVGWITN